MKIDDLIQKSADNGAFSSEELLHMLSYPPDAPETFRILAEAGRISRELTGNRAEVQGQFALNLAPCACNCKFCSFSAQSKIFSKATEISVDEAVAQARLFEDNGANAIYVMTTAFYPFEKFLDISKEVRRSLKKETVMIANVGDKTSAQARQIKEAGYKGVYHALRMREGVDTDLDPEQRRISMRNFQEAGLSVGTCVEPVGPEHTNEEIAGRILFTASISPAFSGAARRITIPGGPMEPLGMISELRMAQIVAVTRLAMPRTTLGNCAHEPCTLGALAGANLFWAEVGANPRDIEEKTEQGRGDTVDHCKTIYEEAGWEVHTGPSRYF
ncbi:MAG: radical SAM protein [Thermodesulfobacteriota bacterium]|nr:radical SAM protein [Thermodesulfobacteriota bacterium]